jgi:FlaA1/EpsC-like NDP-sugar epimerase
VRVLNRATEELLLGRPVRSGLSEAQKRTFAGRRILITGAGGSIGAELARQLAACQPAELVLVDHAEYALFTIARTLQESDASTPLVSILADVSRSKDIAAACRAHRPEFVFHAAACKHVTIAEESIVPALRTNVLGAVYTARAAREVGARFVLISSDKAAEPRSVMGASKRMAELLVLRAAGPGGSIAVRFGNVLGSSGSVVEILLDAARAGRALPVTDPESTRFFMTAAEAVSLVLKAAISGRTGEVFWLDMGQAIRLGALVERILDVATPAGAARSTIDVIGLRPGEKRHEELTTQGLEMRPTGDPAIWRARQAPVRQPLGSAVADLRKACAAGDALAALTVMRGAVPDYTPSEHACSAAARTRAVLCSGRKKTSSHAA